MFRVKLELNTSGPRLLRVTQLLIWTCTVFPWCKCDQLLLSSKRALKYHKRKKHNFEAIDVAKVFKCGRCEASFTISCHLLRHLRNQQNSSDNYRCFSCPDYLGNLSKLTQHKEQYHSDVSFGGPNINVSDLLDFTTEAVNSKFQMHRLMLGDSDGLNRSITLFLRKIKSLHLWILYWVWLQTLKSVEGLQWNWKSLWRAR